ncbi:MAG: secG [Proteobacteria bacterium]|nr:secG [Pseudomonadota bacterium]
MYQALIVVHVLIAVSIIGLVMLQQGRGADAGAGFGGGASNTVFGARGSASFLSRTTAILAAVFFSSSLFLAYLGDNQDNKKDELMETPAAGQAQPDLPPAAQTPAAPAKPADLPDQGDVPQKAQ